MPPQWIQAPSYSAAVDRRLIGALWPQAAVSGCAVTVSAGMVLNIAAGQVAIPTPNNTGTTLCTSDATEQVTLTAAPGAGSNRIDLVIARARGNDLDGGANDDFVFQTVNGSVAASPTPPAVPSGAVALAQVYVTGGTAAIVAGNITDRRPTLGLQVPAAPFVPHTQVVNQFPSVAFNSSSASYVDWWSSASGGPLAVLGFTKQRDETSLQFRIGGPGYVVNVTGHRFTWAVNVGGSDREVMRYYDGDPAGQQLYRHISGELSVTGLPAGVYDSTARFKVDVGATSAFQIDTHCRWYLAVTETMP
jgi:hypothetical protein